MNHQCGPNCSCCVVDSDAPIAVSINPEARVTAQRTAAPLDRGHVGAWTDLPYTVMNDGFVTGPLVIETWPVDGLEIDAPQLELTGVANQRGLLHIRLAYPGSVDITLRFWSLGAIGGLANKNTVTLLYRADELPVGDEGDHEGYIGHHSVGAS